MANKGDLRAFGESFDALGLGDDINVIGEQSSKEDALFDCIIGHIEDVLMEDGFQKLQRCFLEKYWKEFEYNEENKLCYTDIFKEYLEIIERHIENHLASKIPNFSMQLFIHELQKRKDELDGEVFEILDTFSDFLAFKQMFLDYRAVQEGRVEDLSKDICVISGCKQEEKQL